MRSSLPPLQRSRETNRNRRLQATAGKVGGDCTGDKAVTLTSQSTDPVSLPESAPVDSVRTNFAPRHFVFTTESTIDVASPDEGSGGTREEQPPAANTVAEDRAEAGASTRLEASSEGTTIAPIMRQG